MPRLVVPPALGHHPPPADIAGPGLRQGRARHDWAAAQGGSSFGFASPPLILDDRQRIAKGYRAEIVIRWGNPVVPGAPAFDIARQSPAAHGGSIVELRKEGGEIGGRAAHRRAVSARLAR